MIPRYAETVLHHRLEDSASVVLLGPRQVGKTTMARDLAESWPAGSSYLDLERPADARRLDDADSFLRAQAPRLTVLDEVHRLPGLFEVLRGVIDQNRRDGFRTGQFLLLGSASLDLIKSTSESLAGRVSHLDLAGITADEADGAGIGLDTLWLRGGFPDALTAPSEAASAQWRADLIRSYLERDVPMFAPRLPAQTLRRLWTMLAHNSGGLLNASRLAANLAISGPTVDRYIDLLTDLALVRRLAPWHTNTHKRLTKSPKVFVRDSGLLHTLLEITTMDGLLGHPSVGASFESLCVESLVNAAGPGLAASFYRTATGDEIDLLLTAGTTPVIGIEIKLSSAPTLSAGFYRACDDLQLTERYLVHPDTGGEPYSANGTTVIGLTQLAGQLRSSQGA
jgi:predicted AAA+ superfamily ATPase